MYFLENEKGNLRIDKSLFLSPNKLILLVKIGIKID